ncbi:unnamed protein product [Phytophthora fragariaefolia]|uniref:Unnamed protein product n=1 Tax=Phytophthora fragariaefolia TaxID=1490495 RepID=A0A9W6Y2C2_9STRA|nr:unnamed protein product [Phytophthora fragariaefolia]
MPCANPVCYHANTSGATTALSVAIRKTGRKRPLSVLQALVSLLVVVWYAIPSTAEGTAAKTDTTTADDVIVLSEVYGGPHGYAFSDVSSITLGQTLSSVTVRGDRRVDAISVQAAKNLDHGGSGGKEHVLVLETGEYINSMEIHWGKKGTHTRVFYVKLGSNKGNYVSAGTKTANNAIAKAPKGFQLGGFYGRAAGEVDQLGTIWTRRSAKPAKLTDRMGTGWYGKRIRNWVGPTIGSNSDTACYRQMEPFNSSNVCPSGYTKNGGNCIAQCPLAYPVKCFLECIPQNDDCALEIIQKSVAVVAAIFNVATAGIFGAIFNTYKHARRYFFCGANVIGVIRSIVYYIRFQQTTAPQGAVEEILAVAYQSDVVAVDLPVAICHCLGIHVPPSLQFTGIVMMIVENIVKQVIINGDEILSSAQNVYKLLSNASAINSSHTSTDELQDLMDTESTCGYQLKHLTDRVIFSVINLRNSTPGAKVEDVRVQISNSRLVQKDIPAATNNCMNELLSYKTKEAAFETRDLLRKTVGVIIEQLITTGTTNMGRYVAEEQYILEVTNLGLTMLAGLDPTRIVWLASQFMQPTCGPTSFIGEIDDGTLYDALGLKTVDEAFVGSYGWWKKKGDGTVNIIFKSIDTKNVTVVIHSGGEKFADVDVKAGEMVTWNSTVAKLQDKVLYLDRWRPNVIGLNGSGGGSLKLWVPRSSKGGHLTMHVMINVASPVELELSHGGSGGTDKTLTLTEGEFINSMEIHWAKKGTSSSVFYLDLGTSDGNSVSGGTVTENNATVTAPEGYQLSGLLGRAEGAVDQLGVIWTKISAKASALTDSMGSDWYGERIRNWVGPTIGVASDSGCYYGRSTTSESDVVLFDLPIAVCNCLGTSLPLELPAGVKFADTVLVIVETIVNQAITNGDQILSSAANVLALLTKTNTTNSTADASVDELQGLIDSSTTCGYQLKNLTDHVIALVIRNATPNATVEDIRVAISSSSITATTDLGATVKETDYMLEVANMGLAVLGGLDTTGIAYMVPQFVQPTCGPSSFISDIDDGSLHDALEQTTVDEAFEGSYGTWMKESDGVLDVIFESTDTKDVTVVIHAGGDDFAQVDVGARDSRDVSP